MKSNKITDKQFAFFKKSCSKYIELYGLMDWEIYLSKRKLENKNAETTFGVDARKADISFCDEWKDEYVRLSDDVIERVAHHEVLHIVLASLSIMVNEEKFISNDERNSTEHGIIMRLLNAYYEK